MRVEGKWVLITGAASGIGRECARLLAQRGAQLLLVDINRSAVDQLAAQLQEQGAEAQLAHRKQLANILSYALDLTDTEAVERLAAWVEEEGISIEILINNAGLLRVGDLLQSSLNDWDSLYRLNLRAVVQMTQLFLPAMIREDRGAIINIASASAKVALVDLTAYSAIKAAVLSLSQATRASLFNSKVRVSSVCPGLVKTDILKAACLSPEQEQELQQGLERNGIAPRRIAEAVLHAIKSGSANVDVGLDGHILGTASRLLPTSASSWLARIARFSSAKAD